MGIDYLVIGAIAYLGLMVLIGMFTSDNEKTVQNKGDNSEVYYEDDDNDTEDYAAMIYNSNSDDHDEITDPTYCYLSYNIYHDTCYTDFDEDTYFGFDSYYADDDYDDDTWNNCWDYDEYCWNDSDDWDD